MRIGVALPTDYYNQLVAGMNPVDYLLDQARKLAGLGVPAVWLTQRFDYDALAVAALIGREIPDITVGTAVVPIHPRHPNALSVQAQTAQAAAHGRFELGLGLSLPEIAAGYGNTHPRIRYLREYLTALRDLLHTGAVDHTGETLVAKSPTRSMVPTLHSSVPVLLATSGPLPLQVAELTDGALPLLTGPDTLADFTIPTLARHAAAAGRPTPRVISMVSGVVSADVSAARDRAAQQMDRYGQMPTYRALLDREKMSDPAELAAIGDEQAIADAVARYTQAGADELIFTLTASGSTRDEERTWALLGELSRTSHA